MGQPISIQGKERRKMISQAEPGSYHPIIIGDVLVGRCCVVHKLSYGTFSTIWLARDKQRATYVAIKVSTTNAPPREAEILCALAESSEIDTPGRGMVPIVQDQFELQGPNGCHRCYVTPPAQGSVAESKFCDLFVVETARVLVARLVLAVVYTHARGLVHGDIHLGNSLIRLSSRFDELSTEQLYKKFGESQMEDLIRVDGKVLLPNAPPHATIPGWLGKTAHVIPPDEAHLLLSDFGEAFSPPHHPKLFSSLRNPSYFHLIYGHLPVPSGIFLGHDLFLMVHSQHIMILPHSRLITSDPHQCQQNGGTSGRHATNILTMLVSQLKVEAYFNLLSSFEEDIQAMRREDGLAEFGSEETVAILAMLRVMLVFRRGQRWRR
ncbi:hypothetical protein AJ80_02842 [Polytolypa hystricis UAMH7299]|uniref:non-specific serine/threonine protein kinase n=1 Tax=Polytolypa hystricis (strain UAMH7299) TaxID=1447883 RepID=A0A2B7YQA5_POLH7|nr:hypothetical protein AJ80_02842 [Polytolypa hystricis UAMH7299]